MALFNLKDITDDIEQIKKESNLDKSEVLVNKFINTHEERIKGLKDLLGKLPIRDECMFLWSINSFNAFTFIPYILKHGGVIENIVVSTYSINKRIIDAFVRYIDQGLIKNVYLLLSDSLKYRVPAVIDHLTHIISTRNIINVRYAWVHAKITLIECNGEHYVIEGSGNWSENSRFEQYIFMNSKKVYDFREKWIINKIIE